MCVVTIFLLFFNFIFCIVLNFTGCCFWNIFQFRSTFPENATKKILLNLNQIMTLWAQSVFAMQKSSLFKIHNWNSDSPSVVVDFQATPGKWILLKKYLKDGNVKDFSAPAVDVKCLPRCHWGRVKFYADDDRCAVGKNATMSSYTQKLFWF